MASIPEAPKPKAAPINSISGAQYLPNEYDQKALLDAFRESNDPTKLKEIIGVKTVAEVYRTLDRIAIRREFHKALDRAGIDFDFLISGLKREALGGDKSADRIKALEIFLKALGLNKYEEVQAGSATTWEERLLEAVNAKKKSGKRVEPKEAIRLIETNDHWKSDVLGKPGRHEMNTEARAEEAIAPFQEEYEVKQPQVPESVQKKIDEEDAVGKSLMSHDRPRV